MGTFTLSKTNRLFWLGRYVERAYIAIEQMEKAFDQTLDGEPFDYVSYCSKLAIPANYANADEFLQSYLFDRNNPDSAVHALSMAFDNAVVLRETIGSLTLSYIQMALTIMESANTASMAPMLDLQNVKDDLVAFKGAVDDYIADDDTRMIIKIGFNIENIDMRLRLDLDLDTLDAQFGRLTSRMQRTRMARDAKTLRLLINLVPCPSPAENKEILLECVENLFPDA